ncbi:hypothetical protein NDU88_003092 [Pleurodeles waltl]|uniref:Uncharacterized protein n=1 Tax=Pleurodeles waltl TaxID=8319 RepID=A0AAV7KTW7_PLEWA|nr:hypothetical protein NDU88_003092 [Pleurodeles waltl]
MESYPGGTYKRIADPEELVDPDIWDATAAIKEKETPEGVCPQRTRGRTVGEDRDGVENSARSGGKNRVPGGERRREHERREE